MTTYSSYTVDHTINNGFTCCITVYKNPDLLKNVFITADYNYSQQSYVIYKQDASITSWVNYNYVCVAVLPPLHKHKIHYAIAKLRDFSRDSTNKKLNKEEINLVHILFFISLIAPSFKTEKKT